MTSSSCLWFLWGKWPLLRRFHWGAFFAQINTFRVISLFVALLGLSQILVSKFKNFPYPAFYGLFEVNGPFWGDFTEGCFLLKSILFKLFNFLWHFWDLAKFLYKIFKLSQSYALACFSRFLWGEWPIRRLFDWGVLFF